MQIPLINEHLFCKYFVRLSVGNATKGFATYGCCHPRFKYIFLFFLQALVQTSRRITEVTHTYFQLKLQLNGLHYIRLYLYIALTAEPI